MRSIIIPAVKSLTVTNKYPNRSLNEGIITVGADGKYKYYSYLFFDISSLPCDVIITNAELVLFKTDKFFNDNNKKVSISPLRDYFSTYTTYDNAPDYDHYTTINFYPLTSKVAVTVNVTTVISSWLKSKSNNKGIILYSKNKDSLVSFGSVKSDDNYLIPFLKINYEHSSPDRCKRKDCDNNCDDICKKHCNDKCIKICKEELEEILIKICKEICKNKPCPHPEPDATVREVRVTGTVAPLSIYYIIVNLEVTRAGNNHKDNYYISDTYDNSSNNDSLFIDKIYNIAVIPKIQPGDVENVSLYGSYKGPVSIL